MQLTTWFTLFAVACGTLLLSRRLLHYFQLESYQFRGFLRTVNRQLDGALLPGLLLGGCVCVLMLLRALIPAAAGSAGETVRDIAFALAVIGAAWLLRKRLKAGAEKKPFRMTARVKRLVVCLGLVIAGASLLCGVILRPVGVDAVLLSLVPLALPIWVLLAALLAWPVERLIYELYFRDARRKLLADDRLIRIGITGSYGKTSTKFILRDMLSQKYNVLATPDSFNTPMGITSIIRSRLAPSHQVFIAEMGARHPGDIKELCRLVHPTIGVLTSVGPQHLDTFGTIERIRNTKYDLIRSLPEDGLAVFADDGGIVSGLYEETAKPKLLANREDADAWASDITTDGQGSSFTLHLRYREPFRCTTLLLGRHNIANITLAAAAAAHLGVSSRQLQAAISGLRPVDHRLQIVSAANGVTVIDDAFNTNPVSSKAALDVLRGFEGRRIIVTPGMVELGAEEARYNREFGEYMADCVDLALLVGPHHTEPIREGLIGKGFDPEAIRTFRTLQEAVDALHALNQPGDVVMYENDLPDSYTEE